MPHFGLYSCEIREGRVPLTHPRLTVSRKLNRLRKTRESRFLTAKAVRNDKKVKVLAALVSSCPPQKASKREFSAALQIARGIPFAAMPLYILDGSRSL